MLGHGSIRLILLQTPFWRYVESRFALVVSSDFRELLVDFEG
jgi:hypothetical protein